MLRGGRGGRGAPSMCSSSTNSSTPPRAARTSMSTACRDGDGAAEGGMAARREGGGGGHGWREARREVERMLRLWPTCSRSSKAPRYCVPATRLPTSSEIMRLPANLEVAE